MMKTCINCGEDNVEMNGVMELCLTCGLAIWHGEKREFRASDSMPGHPGKWVTIPDGCLLIAVSDEL